MQTFLSFLYVDELFYCDINTMMKEECKKKMQEDFEMTNLGLMRYFLGIQVKQSKGEIFISQEKYGEDILKKFNMSNYKPVATLAVVNDNLTQKVDASMYHSLVGSLIYHKH